MLPMLLAAGYHIHRKGNVSLSSAGRAADLLSPCSQVAMTIQASPGCTVSSIQDR